MAFTVITFMFIVTIFLLDAIDFHSPVKLGQVMHLSARATFTSSRSMEIEVVVDAKDFISGKKENTHTHLQLKVLLFLFSCLRILFSLYRSCYGALNNMVSMRHNCWINCQE